jgi:hypothetical protein
MSNQFVKISLTIFNRSKNFRFLVVWKSLFPSGKRTSPFYNTARSVTCIERAGTYTWCRRTSQICFEMTTLLSSLQCGELESSLSCQNTIFVPITAWHALDTTHECSDSIYDSDRVVPEIGNLDCQYVVPICLSIHSQWLQPVKVPASHKCCY